MPSHGPCQEPVITVTTVIAGQVETIRTTENNRRTTRNMTVTTVIAGQVKPGKDAVRIVLLPENNRNFSTQYAEQPLLWIEPPLPWVPIFFWLGPECHAAQKGRTMMVDMRPGSICHILPPTSLQNC